MSKKSTTKKKGRSGNPKKAAEQAAAAAVVKNPCLRCGKNPKSRGGIWCLTCADVHRKRGRNNRPSAEMKRRTVLGLAVEYGLADPSVVEFPPPIDLDERYPDVVESAT